MSHTPGPWKYGFESMDPDWAIVTAAGGAIVANVNSETGPDAISAPATRKMPAESNARLIAAAPDLLTNARNAADALENMANEREWRGQNSMRAHIQHIIDNTRAAIAKAEGA